MSYEILLAAVDSAVAFRIDSICSVVEEMTLASVTESQPLVT